MGREVHVIEALPANEMFPDGFLPEAIRSISDSTLGTCVEHYQAQLKVKFSCLRRENLAGSMIERFDGHTNSVRQAIS